MSILILVVFVLGYIFIATEHSIKIDKAATALITGMVCWAIYVFTIPGEGHEIMHVIEHGANPEKAGGLMHHLYDIANILFFLLGAMTIVEMVDAHEGFSVITDRIKTTKAVKLLWIVCILTFFFSAVLDNLTTSIVMISLLRKLVEDKEQRWLFAGMVVVAANAGGAWSPIGDVTTTMLWIKGQLPDVGLLLSHLFLPSLVAVLVPVIILSFTIKGDIKRPVVDEEDHFDPTTPGERKLVFILGIAGLLFVPVFKTITHLPPFMGMMLSLGIIWVVTEILHRSKNKEERDHLSVLSVLKKVDTPSVLFFLGILLAVAALQEIGHLGILAAWLQETVGNIYAINIIIGLLSAIVDNVPLVAAAQGMYEVAPGMVSDYPAHDQLAEYVVNGHFWQLLAFCAGTGGSALIIGSAAGVAVMGLEKINFFWYMKKISLLAILGFFAGAATYYIMFHF